MLVLTKVSAVLGFLLGVSTGLAGEPPQTAPAVLAQARTAIAEGRFGEAEELLAALVPDPNAPVVDEPGVLLEIMRRIRLDYPLTAEQMLARLREQIPDVTPDDVARWQARGDLQHRVIDGQTWFFAREPGNFFRFCAEGQARRKPVVKPAGEFDLTGHVVRLLELARREKRAEVYPVRHRIRYELHVKEGNRHLRPGAKVRCWLPFPQEYRQQRDVRLIAADPPGASVAPNGVPQRTVYFEYALGDPPAPPRFTVEFEYICSAYVPELDPKAVRPYETEGELYREYTAERPPHIVFSPEIRTLASELTAGETNPLLRARRIFRWISQNVRWCAEMEYSTIPNISAKALAARRGDCGVQSLLFITLCRAARIPARWQSGWQTMPGDWNMHDWAEFYVEPWGWLPADVSYGLQEHPDVAVQEFYCGHLDPYRLIVNLDYGRELFPPKTSFRSEPVDFQRGEIEIDSHNLYFNEWEWTFDVRATPLVAGWDALPDTLDGLVPELLRREQIPGAVLAIGQKLDTGFCTWQKAYGFLQIEPQRRPMQDDAIFDLASVTKPVATATSLMLLVERGRLGLDDPVARYLPEFDTDDKRTITVRQLMTHTSGMPPYVGAERQKEIRDDAGFPCPGALRAYVRRLPLQAQPGQTVIYSCLNAILCAELVERLSGQPLDRFSAENIFVPLGMTDTGFNPPAPFLSRCVPTTRAEHGRGDGGFLCGQVHDPLAALQAGVSGNAGLFSTARDLARFAQMMLNGGELDGVRILKAETVAEMARVQNPGVKNAKGQLDRRGLLWDLYVPDPEDTGVDALFAYGHTGYTGTALRIYPAQGVYIIALTNRVHPDDHGKVEQFRRQIWQTVGELLLNARPTTQPAAVSP